MRLPDGFKEKYQKLLGEEAQPFLASFDQAVEKGFRVNPLKGTVKLHDHSIDQPISYSDWGYYGKVNGKTIDHQSGLVYSQEPSAMLVGEIAYPQPGQKVLDLCAAPGGKTTYLASFMAQEGLLVTNEINRGRAKVLAENVERFGIQNAVILNESPDRLVKKFNGYFDLIVVDAPCSGEGMFRKDPEAVEYWSLEYPEECARRQREILKSAMQLLAPNGNLVYSTCTFAPEEDEQIIAWLLENYPDLKMEPVARTENMDAGRPEWANGNPELAKAIRLFPHHFKGEGHFIAKLSNHAEAATPQPKGKRKKKGRASDNSLDREQQRLWQDFANQFLVNPQSFAKDHLIVHNQRLYYQTVPVDLSGLRIVKPGLELGEFKKRRFEPSLGLLMALQKADIKQVVEITPEQWQKYVHGEEIATEAAGRGWVALAVDDIIVGPGKLVQGKVKNFYPKGLRINFAVK